MGLLLLFFALSMVFSFLCSVWEAVLLSITPSYTSMKQQEGTRVGELLGEFKEDIDRPLSAILTLNTVAHTVGAIGVGAQAGKVFGDGSLGPISYEAIIASVMTLAILVLSEIIPKTIGANMWQSLAPFTVKSLNFLLKALKPFVWMSQLITKRLKKDKDKSVFSRADFQAMAQVGEQSGEIMKSESMIISNLMKLKDLTVNDIMTPRTVLITADENMTVREFYDQNDPIRYSRIPIHKGKEDSITGMVLKDDILRELAEDKDATKLQGLSRTTATVPNGLSLQELFDKLIGQKLHMALVHDTYGSLVGLVTMEDLLETILGLEITDEFDSIEDLQKLARKKWKKRSGVKDV